MIIAVIAALSLMSYYTALKGILGGEYKPNLFTRIIWLLLAINGLVGLLRLDSTNGILALSAVQTFGSFLVLLTTLKRSRLEFGIVEKVSTVLLLLSGIVWLVGDYAIINVLISLIGYFIGGIPTIAMVLKDSKSEKTMFWGYFAIASMISLATSDLSEFDSYIFPLYFALFNSGMVLLSQRHNLLPRK